MMIYNNADFFNEDGSLNDFTMKHLDNWIKYYIHLDEQESTKKMILSFLLEHEEVLERGFSWTEIRNFAEKEIRLDK